MKKRPPRQPSKKRVEDDITDDLDEEFEQELGEDDIDELVGKLAGGADLPGNFRATYFRELLRLQRELVRLQDWVSYNKERLVIMFEGRDAAARVA